MLSQSWLETANSEGLVQKAVSAGARSPGSFPLGTIIPGRPRSLPLLVFPLPGPRANLYCRVAFDGATVRWKRSVFDLFPEVVTVLDAIECNPAVSFEYLAKDEMSGAVTMDSEGVFVNVYSFDNPSFDIALRHFVWHIADEESVVL